MSTRILHETPKQRNRRLLLAAWDRGIRVVSHWGGRYNVTSATEAGKFHEVLIWVDSDDNRHETCTCAAMARRGDVVTLNAGTAQAHVTGTPCSHILVARWHRLPAARKADAMAIDPELAAAYEGRGQLAEVA